MNIHNINVIAGYEVKLLRRSWLFRIFAILALLILTIVLLSQVTPAFWKYNETWDSVALTSLIPYFTIYFYNIAQSVIVIFLAGSFLKRDKKLDTAEVIYVRPMSNADYIIGKVYGILRVFISLNIITFLITISIHLLIAQTPFSIVPYIFYLLTISVPSLLFILGLSFTMMCLLKNQAVTFIVMLGIVGTTFFYLKDTLYGTFDFFGANIPAIFSDVTGMGNLGIFLLQRSVYFLIGTGLICFTIMLVKRLPHRPWKNIIIGCLGALLVIAGACSGLSYVMHFNDIKNIRNEFIRSFDQYAEVPKVQTLSNEIIFEQHDKQFEAESRLVVKNTNSKDLQDIILYLNPALQVVSLESNGAPLSYTRNNQVIIIDHKLPAGEEMKLSLKYQGGINEYICYTDIEEKDLLAYPSVPGKPQRFYKQYAFLDNTFTQLTPECIWYPVSIPPVNPAVPYNIKKNFTNYSLTVINPGSRTVLSQGQSKQEGDKIIFTNRTLLPGISLTIANYEKKEISIDSTTYELYYFKGHDYFSKYFNELSDTLPAVIRDIRNDLEVKKGRVYTFRKFVMAEVPIQFTGYIRNWKGYTESVMPEILFIPEMGIGTGADFRASTQRTRDWRGGPDELLEDRDLQVEMLKNYFQSAFVEESVSAGRWSLAFDMDVNKLSIAPMFFGHTGFIHSTEYPVVDIAINTMLGTSAPSGRAGWMNSQGMSDVQRANIYLQSHSFEAATKDRNIKPQIFYELLKMKSAYLKNYITAQISVEEFNAFMKGFAEKNQFREADLNDLISSFTETSGIDLTGFFKEWYYAGYSPSITIKDVDANKVVVDDFTKYQIRFKINNSSAMDGIITVKTVDGGRRGGPRGFRGGGSAEEDNTRSYIIPAQSAREIKLINDERPGRMTVNTTISNNLPNEFNFSFSKVDNEISDTTRGIFPISPDLFAPSPQEIIVDNEDKGFSLIESNTRHKLKDLFAKEEEEKYQNFLPWGYPSKWTATVSSKCYGETIHSAFYKKKGTGANQAEWKITIPQSNYYEVFVWNPIFESMMMVVRHGRDGQGHQDRTQTYTIQYDNEKEDIPVDLAQEGEGWISLGSFFFSEGEIKISLSDKVSGDYVVADAVRLVMSRSSGNNKE